MPTHPRRGAQLPGPVSRAVPGMVRGGPAGRLHHRLRLEQGQARTGQTQDDNIFFFKCFLFLIVTSQKIFQMGITNII